MRTREAVTILTGFTLLALVALSGCRNDSGPELTDSDPSRAILAELAASHGAVVGWEEGLVFSIAAQERLTAGTPIVFKGHVDDVYRRNGGAFVRLWTEYPLFARFRFVFDLACSQRIVDTILARTANDSADPWFIPDEYAVVAMIDELFKAGLSLQALPISEDDAEIVVASSELLVATGTCVDIAYLGDYFGAR